MTAHHPPTHPVAIALQALLEQSRALAALGDRAIPTYLPGEAMPAKEASELLAALTVVRQQLQQVENAIGAEALPLNSCHGLAHPTRARFVHGVQVDAYAKDSCGLLQIILRDVEAEPHQALQTLLVRPALRQLRPWPQDLECPAPPAPPALPADTAEPAPPTLPAKLAEAAEPAKEAAPGKPAAAPVAAGAPPAAASTTPAANGKAPEQPVALATKKQLDLIRNQLKAPQITDSERERVEKKLDTFNRREASTCIDTLGTWIKDRGLTTPAPEPVQQGPIYHLFYKRQHATDRHLYLLCRRTYPQALSFAHAYELLLADLKQHQPLAAAQGFKEEVSLLAINGLPLKGSERTGHLDEPTLDAVQELADSLDPPKVPEGQPDKPDPYLPA